MREESVEKILKNLKLPEGERLPMTVHQANMLKDVEECLSMLEEDSMTPTRDLVEKLMKKTGMSNRRAYDVIWVAREALGNRHTTTKSLVREAIMEMMRTAHKVAQTLEPEKQVEALVKIANTLARAFATSQDDGEIIDAAKYLTEEAVRISTDPSIININTNDAWRAEVERLKKKYHIEDADYTDVTPADTEAQTEGGEA